MDNDVETIRTAIKTALLRRDQSAVVLVRIDGRGDSRVRALLLGAEADAEDADALVAMRDLALLVGLRVEGATVTDPAEEIERLRAENVALRGVIEGRTEPPSDEEIKAHAAACGRWAVSTRDGSADLVTLPRAVHLLRDERAPRYAPKRWVALDADCRPCAWPVVGGNQ